MALVAFFLGLALGLGFYLVQRLYLNRQLDYLLQKLPADDLGSSLPVMVRLRRAIIVAKEDRQQLEEQVQLWQELLQIAPLGYLQVDEENQLLWCNQQARQLLSIQNWEPERSRLLLKVVRSFELDELIDSTRTQQQPCECEWVFHPTLSGSEVMGRRSSLTLRGYSWPLARGQVGVFLENRQDVVALTQARNRWVSDLAHELRTPLTSIRLVAEALQGRLEGPTRTWVERMLLETNRLSKLVQDWLDLIQMEADPSKNLNRKLTQLLPVIDSAWQTLEPLARQKQITFSCSAPSSLSLFADESRLIQVFVNVFDNSIRYSPVQAVIQVEASLKPSSETPKTVQIDVVDCGPGFPEADLPYVFERLYRGEVSRVREEGGFSSASLPISTGSGLGLAIVRQIVLAHGGNISANNHPETGGAWVQIQLPLQLAGLMENSG